MKTCSLVGAIAYVTIAATLTYGAANSRFIDNGDGTLTDIESLLMWQKKPPYEQKTHGDAVQYCKSLTLGQHKDWRLPEGEEVDGAVVEALMQEKQSQDGMADYFWSKDPGEMIPFNYPTSHIGLSNRRSMSGGPIKGKGYARGVRNIVPTKTSGTVGQVTMPVKTSELLAGGDLTKDMSRKVYVEITERKNDKYWTTLAAAQAFGLVSIQKGDEASLVVVPDKPLNKSAEIVCEKGEDGSSRVMVLKWNSPAKQ